MNPSSLLRKAKTRYDEDGMRVLAKNTIQFGYRNSFSPIVAGHVNKKYPQIINNYSELKESVAEDSIWMLSDDIAHLQSDNIEGIKPLKNNSNVEFNDYPDFVPNDPYVAEIENIAIVGPDAVALNNDGKVIAETINSTSGSHNGRVSRAITSAVVDSPYHVGVSLLNGSSPSPATSVQHASILHSRWNNYYHWTLEHLLKLRGVSHYESKTGNDVVLIIPPNPPSFILESLQLLGYDESEYIEWNNNPIQVDNLVVPSFPELTPKTIEWLRTSMLESVDTRDTRTDWVYISRQNEDIRRIKNYDEVESVLDDYDITTVFCEELSMEEEIRLFSSIKGIIGAHGAGLTAMVWGTDIEVIEIFNDVIKRPYYILADVLGHNYDALSGQSVGNASQKRNRNIIVDADELEEKLERIMK